MIIISSSRDMMPSKPILHVDWSQAATAAPRPRGREAGGADAPARRLRAALMSHHQGPMVSILLLVGLLAGGLAGCAGPESPTFPPSSSDRSSDGAAAFVLPTGVDCRQWFVHLDEAVDQAGVRDGGPTRLAGFPYLRLDRFLASFAPTVADAPARFDAWIVRLRELDRNARTAELQTLGPVGLASLGVRDVAVAEQRSESCADRLQREDLETPERRHELADHAQVPDDYHSVNQALGVYPLTRIPFGRGIERWHQDTAAQFQQAAAVASSVGSDPSVVRFEPASHPVDARTLAALFARAMAHADALGIPEFAPDDRAVLLQAFAPVFEIGTTGSYDRFGPLVWRGEATPDVDSRRPAAYQRLAFTRVQGRALVQLVYTLWFPERPEGRWLDLLSGRLDGVVIRVTLDAQGQPLIYDSIHPCGCYHMFFPTKRVVLKPPPDGDWEWAFVPISAPTLALPQRLVVRTESRTHFIVSMSPDRGEATGERHGTPYDLLEDQALRALPMPAGGARSVFAPDGLIPGTERSERLLFWPMGISSPGAMREWGHHATSFTSVRHFDDPDLMDRRFFIPPIL